METSETATQPRPAQRQRRRHLGIFLLVAAAAIGLDQLTKSLVRSRLEVGESWPEDWAVHFTHVTNTGAAFGILEGQSGFLAVTTVIGLAAVLLFFLFPPVEHPLMPAALGLLLGGSFGNLIDRIRLGHVTDFIDFPRYPSFNMADSSIVAAIVIMLGLALFMAQEGREGRTRDDHSHAP